LYLRSKVGEPARASAAGAAPLWWPPSKIAARYLAPYLHADDQDPHPPLDDLPPLHGEDLAESAADHQDALELALTGADADARWKDYRGALRWLAVAEELNMTLPPEYAQRKREWERQLSR
jgi:hypothetical protein